MLKQEEQFVGSLCNRTNIKYKIGHRVTFETLVERVMIKKAALKHTYKRSRTLF